MSRIKGTNYIFREFFKETYKAQGYTQESLAEKASLVSGKEMSETTLKHWVAPKNQRPIPMDKAKLLADILGIDVYEMVGSDGKSSYAKQQRDSLTVANDLVRNDEDMIATLLKRHGRTPLFESDNEELNDYRGEYLNALIEGLLDAHDRFASVVEMERKRNRHEYLLNVLGGA